MEVDVWRKGIVNDASCGTAPEKQEYSEILSLKDGTGVKKAIQVYLSHSGVALAS